MEPNNIKRVGEEMVVKKNKKPLVSVGVVVYNQKNYIKTCIDSILKQDYENLEIIIGDDRSTDGTQKILKKYKTKYPEKIKLILSKKNQGITKNHNNILKKCSGKYIAWLGGDDLFLQNKIKTQVKYMEKNKNIVLSYHNIDVFNSKNNKTMYLFNNFLKPREGDVDLIVKYGTFMGACSVMVLRKACPKKFNEKIKISSDWLFWIETCYNGDIGYINKILSRYRRHEGNITQNINYKSALKERLLTLKLIDKAKLKNKETLKKAFARLYYNYSIKCIINEDNEAKRSIKESIKNYNLGFKQKMTLYLINLNIIKLIKIYNKYIRTKKTDRIIAKIMNP
jgi:glycosyltransferase involved in cell wall biosynthesis